MNENYYPITFYCYLKTKRTIKRDEAVILNYGKVTFLENYDALIERLKPNSTAIFYDVLEFDKDGTQNINDIVNVYKTVLDTGATLMFQKSSNCNSSIISFTVNDFEHQNILKSDREKAFDAILELQIKSYILTKNANADLKRTANIVASKVDGKHLGRPVGTTKETSKAKLIKERIINESVDFKGNTPVGKLIDSLGISRQTYYNYKKQLLGKAENTNNKK